MGTNHIRKAALLVIVGFLCARHGFSAGSTNVSTNANPVSSNQVQAAAATNDAARRAEWENLLVKTKTPPPPPSWRTNAPSPAEKIAFYTPKLIEAADLASNYYTRYPADTNAEKARRLEYTMLMVLEEKMGNTNQHERMEKIEDYEASLATATPIDKLRIRKREAEKIAEGLPTTLDQLEKCARNIIHDYPQSDVGYQALMEVLLNSSGERTKRLHTELTGPNSPESVREAIKPYEDIAFKYIGLLGKPLDLKFTAMDGRQVDVSALKVKVILVMFWSTTCGPCLHELPKVKAVYSKFHDQGFEVVAISGDEDRTALQLYLKQYELPWPEYFDTGDAANEFATRFNVESLPVNWLINKKGEVCDIFGRNKLTEKVTELMAEPEN